MPEENPALWPGWETSGMKIVHRYLLREYIIQFIFSLLSVLVLMIGNLLFELNHLLIGKRTPFLLVVLLVYYRLPMILMDAFPAAVLFGILLSMGRLAREREIEVIRVSGLSFPGIIAPLLIFTFLLSTGSFFFNDYVVPAANQRFQQELRRLLAKEESPLFEENIFLKGADNEYFYIRRVNRETQRMEGIMIYEVKKEDFPRLTTAAFGWVESDRWQLHDGLIYELDERGHVTLEASFSRMYYEVGEDLETFFSSGRSTEEMTRAELKRYMELFGRSGFDISVFAVDYHLKTAVPYASLVLAFLGLPFSTLAARSGKAFGMGLSILLILIYFVSQVVCRTFGVNGLIAPFWAAWAPNLFFLALGGILSYRVVR